MIKLLEQVFGVVFTNKIRIIIANNKRSILIEVVSSFIEWYIKTFQKGGDIMRFYLIISPFFNLFLFYSFFEFVFILILDFIVFRIVTNNE